MYETGSVKVGGKFQPTTEAPLADASQIEGGPQISEFDTPSLDANIPARIRAEGQWVISPSTGEARRFAADLVTLLTTAATDAIATETAARVRADDLRTRAGGYLVPRIDTPVRGGTPAVLDEVTGDLIAYETFAGQPVRTGNVITYNVPRIGDDQHTESLVFDAAGALLSKVIERSFTVPKIGSLGASGITMNPAGEAIAIDAERSVRVPKMGNSVLTLFGDDDEAIVVIEDPLVTDDGSTGGNLAEGFEVASVQGMVTGRVTRQLMMRRSAETWVQLTLGPDGIDDVVAIDAVNGKATVSKDGIERVVSWKPTAQSDGNRVHLVLIAGQSLAVGVADTAYLTDTNAPWRDPVHERAWQFKSADGIQRGPRPSLETPSAGFKDTVIPDQQFEFLEPLRGANHAGQRTFVQTCAEMTSAMLVGQCLHQDEHVIGCVIGTGSTAIADFEPATEHMQSIEKAIEAAYRWGRDMALHDLVVWFVWNQGAEDNFIGTSIADYKTSFNAIRDHLEDFVTNHSPTALIDAVFGGAIIQQYELRDTIGGSTPGMATLAQQQLIEEGAASAINFYPFLPGKTHGHFYPRNYLPLGAATAYQISEGIRLGYTQPVPVHIAPGDATLVDSTTIDCEFSGGNGSYRFDTDQIANYPDGNYGLDVSDSLGDVGIDTVVWINATTIRITLERATSVVSDPVVGLGMIGTSYNGIGDADFLRVNIRDTSGWTCPHSGQIVSGWAILQQVSVTAP